MMHEISLDPTPSEAEANSVLGWLKDFNDEENGAFMNLLRGGAEHEFFLVARDASGLVIGGLRGGFLVEWLKLDVMAVSPDHRNSGIGRRLVAKAERMASGRGCLRSYVDTMSYQAPGFYTKLGYTETGRLPNWDSHGHDKILFTKAIHYQW